MSCKSGTMYLVQAKGEKEVLPAEVTRLVLPLPASGGGGEQGYQHLTVLKGRLRIDKKGADSMECTLTLLDLWALKVSPSG